MKRIISTVFISTSLLLSSVVFGAINSSTEADNLNRLGLFAGTEKGYELDKGLSRTEGAVMPVRMLGKEYFVKAIKVEHPFRDFPVWADNYIGYLYQNNLTSGISATEFGASNKMNAVQYTTLILRAKGKFRNKSSVSKWRYGINIF